jgi:protein-tyrosine phosphatase
MASGINTFVCLQTEAELKKFSSYLPLPQGIDYLTFPIEDRGIANDQKLITFIDLLVDLLQTGKKRYIHCYGGHGRTGIIVSLLMSRYFKIDIEVALAMIRKSHRQREVNALKKTPQGKIQIEQVKRVSQLLKDLNKAEPVPKAIKIAIKFKAII